jgi:hypothetical protein
MSEEQKLETLLGQLRDGDKKKRIKACKELAKLGNPRAIVELVKVYQDDYEEPEVKQAAEDALRVFAEMEQGGSRRKGGGSCVLRGLSSLLALTLLLLIAGNVFLRMGSANEDTTPTPNGTEVALRNATLSPRDVLLNRLTSEVMLPGLNDINSLRAEWSAGAGNLPCTAQPSRISSVPFSAVDRNAYADIATIVDNMGKALAEIALVTHSWDTACATPEKGTAEQVGIALEKLKTAETLLTQAANDLMVAQSIPTPEPSPLPPTPVPTIDPNILTEIETLAQGGKRSTTSLVNDRWIPVQNGERSPFGCSPPPPVGEDYQFTNELFASDPKLAEAIFELNQGLPLARRSIETYVNNCPNNLTADIITQGLADGNQALIHFENTLNAIQAIRER